MAFLNPSTQDDQARILAQLLPDGAAWLAKFETESNTYNLLKGFGGELLRMHQTIDQLVCNFFINEENTLLLPEWEAALGIPDDCFPGTGSDAERVQHVLIKLASLNVIVEKNWIDLAAILGFEVCIKNGSQFGIYPFEYPLHYFNDPRDARFTMIIFIKGTAPDTYTHTYPLTYASSASNILTCIFTKLKPQDNDIIFNFVEELPC